MLKIRVRPQVKQAKTIMGLKICVLEALDDVFDEPPETPTNLAGTPGENETDEDVVSPEVTEELNRLKTLGRPYTVVSVDELMPRMFVYSQKTNEQLETNGGRGPRTRARRVVFSGCVVRDPEDSTESWHQDGSRQFR